MNRYPRIYRFDEDYIEAQRILALRRTLTPSPGLASVETVMHQLKHSRIAAEKSLSETDFYQRSRDCDESRRLGSAVARLAAGL